MPPFATGEARRLTRPRRSRRRSAFVTLALFAACASPDLHARAARDDATHGTSVFTWAYDHDPARLVVWALDPSRVAPYLRNGRAHAATGDVRAACAVARRERALLLVVSPGRSAARTSALDCGVAIERDGYAVVIAPR